MRSPKRVAGGIKSNKTVALQTAMARHDARSRPSDGRISALGVSCWARICGPGRLWNVAEVSMPHQGQGYIPWTFTFGCIGGRISQNGLVRGDVGGNNRLRSSIA